MALVLQLLQMSLEEWVVRRDEWVIQMGAKLKVRLPKEVVACTIRMMILLV